MTPVHAPSTRTGTPPHGPPLGPVQGVVVSPRALRVTLVNAVLGLAALIWLLPAPWGGVVPVLMLAQVVWLRHGALAAIVGLLAGSGLGAGLGVLLGMEDARRAAVALSLLLLPAMAARPRREAPILSPARAP